MQRAQISQVDAKGHAQEARERTRAARRLQAVEQAVEPQKPAATHPQWWHKYFHWEPLTLENGRTVEKGFVITPGIAAVFLAAFLGVLGWAYKSSTADSRETRDSIIRMETMLNERTRTFNEQQAKLDAEMKEERDMGRVYRERQNEKMTELSAALKQNGNKQNQ